MFKYIAYNEYIKYNIVTYNNYKLIVKLVNSLGWFGGDYVLRHDEKNYFYFHKESLFDNLKVSIIGNNMFIVKYTSHFTSKYYKCYQIIGLIKLIKSL